MAPWSLNCTGPSAVRRPGNPGSRGLSCAPIISQRPLKPTKAETVASRLMLCYPMLTNSCRVDCFGHASFVTVISRASLPMACVPCVSGKGNAIPRFLFLMFTGCKRDGHHSGEWDWVGQNLAAHNSTTNPLTATALIYALGAGITAGAGTRLVLQLLLDVWLV